MILLQRIQHREKPVDILVDGGKIVRISPEPLHVPGAQMVDGRSKAVLPGFVNMHTHAAMLMLRGIYEDLSLYKWLENVWKIEARMDGEFMYWATKAACLEMIRSGTTTFNDQYWYCPHTRQAAIEMGLRPVVSFIFLDSGNKEMVLRQRDACQRLYERSKAWGEESQFAISIHSVYTVAEENIRWACEFARTHGLRIHLHVAETALEDADCRKAHGGLSPVQYFDSLGVWGEDVIAAHALHLSDEDVQILGRHKVNCVHNINSNLKLASGYCFRYNELRDAGANVCLGTDGASSSNNLDMLEHMKNAALLQKAWRGNPAELPLQELLDCATVHGARALGLNTGEIREGADADLSIIDTDNCYFLSPAPVLANLVYAAHSNVISSVMVRGKWVMQEGKIPGEAEILAGARNALKKI
ncbi:MAG: amidohydrolase [Bacteroidales bacterium]|nr:amidohydrolase [Bacteroidales bacterium]